MDLQDYKIKNSTKCDCGYEFTLHDLTELKRINDNRFYGGNIKHISKTKCPNCNTNTILFLKQAGQTYVLRDIAQRDRQAINSDTVEQTQISSNESNTNSNELTCQSCKRVFKTKQGLAVHAKTCGK